MIFKVKFTLLYSVNSCGSWGHASSALTAIAFAFTVTFAASFASQQRIAVAMNSAQFITALGSSRAPHAIFFTKFFIEFFIFIV